MDHAAMPVAISNPNKPNRCFEAWFLYSGKAHHFLPVDTNFTSHWSKDKNPTPEKLVSFLQNCEHEAFVMRKVHWDGLAREIPPVIILANNEDGHYSQVFRNRSELNAFIDQLRSQADEIWPAEDAFRFWWDNEGSELCGIYSSEHIAKIAWTNGAYVGCGAQEATS